MRSKKLRLKIIFYSCLLLSSLVINLWYYRQFIFEQWIKHQLGSEYIVVSLSTTPYRINALEATLNTIISQNAPIKAIYLNIPYVFKRDNIPYVIPEWLRQKQEITIIRSDDYGPGTKLLGTLANVDLPANAIIITVDDDVFYPKNAVLHLAYKAKQHPDRAIGIMGANPDYDATGQIPAGSDLGIVKIKIPDALVSILQGYAGIAYRRNFFDENIFELNKAPRDCTDSDDIYLSFYLAKQGIARQVLRNTYINACHLVWETDIGTADTSLHNLFPKPTDKHRSCIAYLKQQDPEVIF